MYPRFLSLFVMVVRSSGTLEEGVDGGDGR